MQLCPRFGLEPRFESKSAGLRTTARDGASLHHSIMVRTFQRGRVRRYTNWSFPRGDCRLVMTAWRTQWKNIVQGNQDCSTGCSVCNTRNQSEIRPGRFPLEKEKIIRRLSQIHRESVFNLITAFPALSSPRTRTALHHGPKTHRCGPGQRIIANSPSSLNSVMKCIDYTIVSSNIVGSKYCLE